MGVDVCIYWRGEKSYILEKLCLMQRLSKISWFQLLPYENYDVGKPILPTRRFGKCTFSASLSQVTLLSS